MTKYGEVRSTTTDSSEHVNINNNGNGSAFNYGYVDRTGSIRFKVKIIYPNIFIK